MKEFYLDTHSNLCSSKKESYFSSYCKLNPQRFLFFLGNDFFLITYYNCMSHSGYDFKKSLIEEVCQKNKIFRRYEVNISVNVERDLKDFRIRNKELRKYISQVNYLYYDGAGKEYAITTLTNYKKRLFDNNDTILKNYQMAKEYLGQKEYHWLLPQLDELFYANCLRFCDEVEIFKAKEHLLKRIKESLPKKQNVPTLNKIIDDLAEKAGHPNIKLSHSTYVSILKEAHKIKYGI